VIRRRKPLWKISTQWLAKRLAIKACSRSANLILVFSHSRLQRPCTTHSDCREPLHTSLATTMKIAQLSLCVALLGFCVLAFGQTCPASFFGSTSAYNVFLLGAASPANFTFDLINGDVEGRVASNGNFRAINFGVGSRLGTCNASLPTLVVGGYVPPLLLDPSLFLQK
jgi:hypothetical protein